MRGYAAALEGRLPDWAVASEERRAHIDRVAALLTSWAVELRLPDRELARWRAAGLLHDALRDADPEELRPLLPEPLRDVPDKLLHGPAVAERLRREGARDEALLDAVAYHTIGHPRLDRLGRCLYLADFLEPGRSFREGWRAALRERMPEELDAVLPAVVAERVRHLIEQDTPVRPETMAFWNDVSGQA